MPNMFTGDVKLLTLINIKEKASIEVYIDEKESKPEQRPI